MGMCACEGKEHGEVSDEYVRNDYREVRKNR